MEGNKNSQARIKANNKYNDKAYDRINIAIKKGGKLRLQEAATAKDMSINGYIKRALKAQLLADLKQDVDL
jgi:predicted HicB family RNase H-like nuclease